MEKIEQWIWLCEKDFPLYQECNKTKFDCDDNEASYCVAEFKKSIERENVISSAKIRISGDTFYELFVNGNFVGNGPAAAGGDFGDCGGTIWHYADNLTVKIGRNAVDFLIRVQLSCCAYGYFHGQRRRIRRDRA